MSKEESTPLLASPGESSNYYFLNNESNASLSSTRDMNGGAIVDELPSGSHIDEFEPKTLGAKEKVSAVRFSVECVL